MACTFNALIQVRGRVASNIRFETSTAKLSERAFSSNDGRGSNLTPARSDGLDNVDGGPDAAFYIQMGVIEQVSIWGRF